MATRRLLIRNRQHALIIGVVGIVVGSYALHEAYEGRHKQRPFVLRFLPS